MNQHSTYNLLVTNLLDDEILKYKYQLPMYICGDHKFIQKIQ